MCRVLFLSHKADAVETGFRFSDPDSNPVGDGRGQSAGVNAGPFPARAIGPLQPRHTYRKPVPVPSMTVLLAIVQLRTFPPP
jgi:hypothetical protein